MANLSVQDSTVNLLVDVEGFSATAFWDYKQYSIGHGSGLMPNGKPVKPGDTVTRSQAAQMLRRDLATRAAAVNRLVTANINQNQWDALVSFVYNVGEGSEGFGGSNLRRIINATPNDFPTIKTEWFKWRLAGGEVNQGVINRRTKEYATYASGAVTPSNIIWIILLIGIFLFIKK